jgi:dipeptidyl aminopeptidase/acylaminoacyl peptidase
VTPDDKEPVAYGPAVFSRDGRTIVVVTDRGAEFRHVARLNVGARTVTRLSAPIEGDVDELAVSPDGRRLAFSANEDGVGTLHLIDAATGRERARPKVPPGNVSGLKWHSSGELGFHLESARRPSDVLSYNPTDGIVTRWTFSELGGVTETELRDHQVIRWKSFDGRMISGIFHRPHPRFAGRRPVRIDIHGGPEDQARTLYWGRSLYFLNELGMAIIQPNVRGSSGFGKTFVKLDDGRKREDAVKDIGALLDWVAAQPDLDPERVWVVGGSYGGYMALAVAATYPERIRCVTGGSGISNFVTFLERTSPDRKDLRRAEYGDERDPEMREFLESISPLTHATDIKVPLFIVHGRNDVQVPPQESQQIVSAVRRNGTPAWYLVFGDEGHGIARRTNQDYMLSAWAVFAEQYLIK